MKEIGSRGMGAIVGLVGVTFRVWAPNVNSIFVMGSFNGWRDNEYPLEHENDGYWAVHVDVANNGDEYKFVLYNGDNKITKNDPYARKLTNSMGNSIVIDLRKDREEHHFQISSFNELVIYEMHIGTFNRDGVENGGVGNFFSAVQRLDYIRDLGINAIEIMPVMEFAGDESWGYNPAHPFAVESAYGGPEGLKYFIQEAHLRGIAVIMDVVYNHFGPSDIDIWQFDGWQENDLGGIYFYNDYRAKTPWGENRPDYGRKEVRNYLRDNALMWLDDYQCDGLRFDATAVIRYLDSENTNNKAELEEGYRFLQELNGEIRDIFPHKILIAEDLKADPVVTSGVMLNGLGFHSQWGLGFANQIKRVLLELEDKHRNLQLVVESLFFAFNNDVFQRVIFTESHDEVANGSSRLPEEIQPGDANGEYAKKKSTLGAIALLTAPGIPMLFQGQEFISYGHFSDTVGLDWERQSIFNGISGMYRDLIGMRNGRDEAMVGLTGHLTETLHFNQDTLVLAYSRSHADHRERPVIMVLNFSNQTFYNYKFGVPMGGKWRVKFNSSWKGYDEDFSGTEVTSVAAKGPFEGKAHSVLVDVPAFGGIILIR
ncbi:alpha-amylase family glycosyl hydrolase [Aquiflexum gelatinilyticum]|uniref:1,4-alpha-glucan branching enzyme n=1 Tax=Aquiflexum gelatinilyticum TaxID=2961943 RepID=A0A9X2P466_9BACT|nr:alpha-amylase family glycosyl hydrolase [Aquiflexum gelatinilyticum]MCR9013813.1 alpha-amylase family glycosyl hydrolase [Aquiflexum gelatinilyticum]